MIGAFVKFGSKKNLKKLINKGELFFNVPSRFNQSKENERGDEIEAAEFVVKGEFTIEVSHPTIGSHTFKSGNGTLIQRNENLLTYSLFEISKAFFEKENPCKINPKMIEFGTHAVLISQPYAFLNSITKRLKESGVEYEMKTIRYKEIDLNGRTELSSFEKKEEHKHQFEFRIVIPNLDNTPQIICIGSISEYCQLYTSKEIVEMMWKAKFKEAENG